MPSEVWECIVWSTKQHLIYIDAFECLQMFPDEPVSRSCFSSLLDRWELCFGLLDRLQILRSERTYGKHLKSWKVWELWPFKVDLSIASDSLLLSFFKPRPFGFHNTKHSWFSFAGFSLHLTLMFSRVSSLAHSFNPTACSSWIGSLTTLALTSL